MPRAIHRSKAAFALYLVVAAALLALVLTMPGGQVQAQSGLLPPPLPMLIGGTVNIGNQQAPDGISIVSRMDGAGWGEVSVRREHHQRWEIQEPESCSLLTSSSKADWLRSTSSRWKARRLRTWTRKG